MTWRGSNRAASTMPKRHAEQAPGCLRKCLACRLGAFQAGPAGWSCSWEQSLGVPHKGGVAFRFTVAGRQRVGGNYSYERWLKYTRKQTAPNRAAMEASAH